MRSLNVDEKRAVATVTKAMIDDVRGFDFANAPEADIAEFIGYAFQAVADEVAAIYEREVPF